MIREPKIPMLPGQRPQQRIHEVVGLPERPEPFDCYVNYNDVGSLPKNTNTNSTYLCQVEWAWTPMHNRLDAYYIHRGRSDWILWNKYWDDNWGRWGKVSIGTVSRRGVDQNQAAIYLLMEYWKFDAKEGGLDKFHWINEEGFLDMAELDAIANEVWTDTES
jgi:hypothetical protein